jgi:hypothetical protein
MSDTLYVGVLRHAYGSESPTSGYNYDEVNQMTKEAYIALVQEVLDCSEQEAECASLAEYSYEVVATAIPIAPKSEPKWFTEAKDIISPLELAEWVFSDADYEFRKECLIERLTESFENYEDYNMALTMGWVKGFDTSEESLSKLATNTGRSVAEYKQDHTLAFVDYLRWETQER